MATVLEGDVLVRGNLRAGSMALGANAVGDTEFKAADPLAADKQEHQHVARYTQPSGTAAVAATEVAHHAHGAGELVAVYVGSVVKATGDSTATVDVKKNGTTVLSGTVVLDNANSNYVAEAGAVASPTYAAGDVFTVVVTVSAGTGTLPQGLYVSLVLREAAD